ncbi:MAG TPA: DUF6516 family protein [Noviherbaspirillum sp.]
MMDESTNRLDDSDPVLTESLYSKTLYVLRESRKALLRQYGVEDEAGLLAQIRSGQIGEHPAYEHYLSARIMEQTREQIRAEMMVRLGGGTSAEVPDISVHAMLKDWIEAAYAQRLCEPPRLAQDALLLSFDSGLMMEVRYFSETEYALHWSWGEAVLRIDTAPVHSGVGSFPHHLHRDDDIVACDRFTQPGTEVWKNFSGLLDVLLTNPLLGESPEDGDASACR